MLFVILNIKRSFTNEVHERNEESVDNQRDYSELCSQTFSLCLE